MATQGAVVGRPGAVVRGKYPLIQLETGGTEELDVIIATGRSPGGPRLLVTGNIHGNEVNPCIICHRLIEWLESAVTSGELAGTVVVWPSLNPTGHRAGTRSPSYERVDPNRYWPDEFATKSSPQEGAEPADRYAAIYAQAEAPGPVERSWIGLFDGMKSLLWAVVACQLTGGVGGR